LIQDVDVEALEEKKRRKEAKNSESKDPAERTCPECGKLYWHKRAMLYHRKIVHSGESSSVCFYSL
jgi:transposase